ncbi:MAG: hypothetical protein AAGF99_11265 [Bacteroidota bacterium]
MHARLGLLSAVMLIAGASAVTAQPLNAWVGVGVGPGVLSEREQGEEGPGDLTGALFASIKRGPVVLTLRAAFAGKLYGNEKPTTLAPSSELGAVGQRSIY